MGMAGKRTDMKKEYEDHKHRQAQAVLKKHLKKSLWADL